MKDGWAEYEEVIEKSFAQGKMTSADLFGTRDFLKNDYMKRFLGWLWQSKLSKGNVGIDSSSSLYITPNSLVKQFRGSCLSPILDGGFHFCFPSSLLNPKPGDRKHQVYGRQSSPNINLLPQQRDPALTPEA